MSEKLITVATFPTPFEAQLAKNRLEAEGIPSYLGDEETAGNLWHLGLALGGVKLLVPDDHLSKAFDLLTAPPEEETPDLEGDSKESQPNPEAIQEGWNCPRCGKQNSADQESCTACESGGDEFDQASADSPDEEQDDSALAEDGTDETVPSLGDYLAFRASKAALFGLLFFPFSLYSCWLLFRLITFPGQISRQGTRYMLVALVLDFLALLVLVPFVFFYFRRF
jgi:Putative prokaryotic signal transducing protein